MDRSDAQKAIRDGAGAGYISAGIMLLLVLAANMGGETTAVLREMGVDAWLLVDVGLTAGLAYGISRGSRAAAVVMFVYFLGSRILTTVETGESQFGAVALLFLYYFGRATIASFALQKYRLGDAAPGEGIAEGVGEAVGEAAAEEALPVPPSPQLGEHEPDPLGQTPDATPAARPTAKPAGQWKGAVLVGAVVVALGLAGLGLTGGEEETLQRVVIAGDDLPAQITDFLVDNKLVLPEDSIVLFYSGSSFSYEREGSVLTNRCVVSYVQAGNELTSAILPYHDIATVVLEAEEATALQVVIGIFDDTGYGFRVAVSTENGASERFRTELERRRLAARAGGG